MLLPHFHGPTGQQKIDSQVKPLEVAAKLEVSPREDAQFRTLQIQRQLEATHLEIQKPMQRSR